jgi:outer membrane lipoprotein-sorting protein
MKLGSKGTFLGGAAIAGLCLLGAAVHAQTAAEKIPMTDEVFKSVMLLKGIPVDTFFEAMGMFASSMGADCTFCHVSKAYFDKTAFAELTPRIARARQMITMMNALNKQYFGGRPRVTCFTCHAGSNTPRSEPDIALQYGPPYEDPNARAFPPDTRKVTAEEILDKYLKAIGGADRFAKIQSFAAKGTYNGFDTSNQDVPVDIIVRAPAQQRMTVHMFAGDSLRIVDGRNGWMAGPDTPLPVVTLTGGNLDGARLEAMLWFPASIRQAFQQWRVGRTAIDDNEVQIVQGLNAGQPAANFYFDDQGLLVRTVRWTQTPVGFVPTQTDYSDYRDVAGVKLPFKRTVSQTYMQLTVTLSNVQPDARVDASSFARPTTSVREAGRP